MVTAKQGYDFKSGRKKFQIMKSKSVIMALQENNNEAEVDEKLEALCKSLIKTYGDQLGGEIFVTKLPADSTKPFKASSIWLSSPEPNEAKTLVQAALVEANEPEIVDAASLAVVPVILISVWTP